MLPGLIYNTCQCKLAGILMLENVNRHEFFEACYNNNNNNNNNRRNGSLRLYASPCLLTKVRAPYESNQLA